MNNVAILAKMFCVHAVNRGLLPISQSSLLEKVFNQWWVQTGSLLTSRDRMLVGLQEQVTTPATGKLPSLIKTSQAWDELRNLTLDFVKYENGMCLDARMGKPHLSGVLDGLNPSLVTTGLFTVQEMLDGECEAGLIRFASSICQWSKPQMQGFILGCIRGNSLRLLQAKINQISGSPHILELYGTAQHVWALNLFFKGELAIPLGGEMLLASQIDSNVCAQILRQKLIANVGLDLTEYEKIFALSFIGNGTGEF